VYVSTESLWLLHHKLTGEGGGVGGVKEKNGVGKLL
jgi:hypothetical protein